VRVSDEIVRRLDVAGVVARLQGPTFAYPGPTMGAMSAAALSKGPHAGDDFLTAKSGWQAAAELLCRTVIMP
jgi:hypothetical protein